MFHVTSEKAIIESRRGVLRAIAGSFVVGFGRTPAACEATDAPRVPVMKRYRHVQSGIALEVEVPDATVDKGRVPMRMTVVNTRGEPIRFLALSNGPTTYAHVKVRTTGDVPLMTPLGANLLGPTGLRMGSGEIVTLATGERQSWDIWLGKCYEFSTATYVMRLTTQINDWKSGTTEITVDGILFKTK